MPWAKVDPIYDPNLLALCRKPYPGHPKGCPNWRKAERCPPKAPMIHKILDLSMPVFAVWNVFDFGAHVAKMRARHPEWSERQLANCLYWQGTARKHLRQQIKEFTAGWESLVVLTTPEACGVNVTATMESIGYDLEWPPVTVTYQVALIGTPIESAPPICEPQGSLF